MSDHMRHSSSGPVCPYCEHEDMPDESFYYDEDTTELDCGSCGLTYGVRIYRSTSWTTLPREETPNGDR